MASNEYVHHGSHGNVQNNCAVPDKHNTSVLLNSDVVHLRHYHL